MFNGFKIIFFTFIIIELSFCSRDKKIEINSKSNTNVTVSKSTNVKLNPEKFFKISSEIGLLTQKYNKMINRASDNQINYLLKQLDKEIQKVYRKYGIDEKEFNEYSEKNYNLLENYLKSHPEIDNKLYK